MSTPTNAELIAELRQELEWLKQELSELRDRVENPDKPEWQR